MVRTASASSDIPWLAADEELTALFEKFVDDEGCTSDSQRSRLWLETPPCTAREMARAKSVFHATPLIAATPDYALTDDLICHRLRMAIQRADSAEDHHLGAVVLANRLLDVEDPMGAGSRGPQHLTPHLQLSSDCRRMATGFSGIWETNPVCGRRKLGSWEISWSQGEVTQRSTTSVLRQFSAAAGGQWLEGGAGELLQVTTAHVHLHNQVSSGKTAAVFSVPAEFVCFESGRVVLKFAFADVVAVGSASVASGGFRGWFASTRDTGRYLAAPKIAAEVRDLLVFACSPNIEPITNAGAEADAVTSAFEDAGLSKFSVQHGGSAETLRQLLLDQPTRNVLLIGHFDLTYGERRTLGFCRPDGALEAIDATALASMIGNQALRRGLRLLFLNGCCSEALGHALVRLGVPVVVCWRTRCQSNAAAVFSTAFFRQLARSDLEDHRAAFAAAQHAVLAVTRPAGPLLSDGTHMHVPTYALRDPDQQPPAGVGGGTIAAGIPVLMSSDSLTILGGDVSICPGVTAVPPLPG